MFLHELSNDAKQSFYKLAYTVMNSDNKATKEELKILKLYEKEMALTIDFDLDNTIEEELKVINTLESSDKKKIYFELMTLAYSDHDYAKEEKDLLTMIGNHINVGPGDQETLRQCAENLTKTYKTLSVTFNK
ncbi:hypothetical protein EZV73_01095 [Acidaminobacter sp. JC074]|uniref:hypothetical protein n=1 Tax=Acidaminobacter sp. JC074 TaxID=2530199 RepID=UPI001F10EA14|nr:hypothetical protein [Acidaminobacter sp. JC074]MCH4886138.1 hypothetical protein [Acidaminobacter sp. JC074]